MISEKEFGKLRLAGFVPNAEISELEDWEFLDHFWVGEALGFSEWLRLESDPGTLRSLALDFAEFPPSAATAVLKAIDLPVRSGMNYEELETLLGQPVEEERFVKDRVTYEFIQSDPTRYRISCTVLNDGGLSYLVVTCPLPEEDG